MNDLLTKEPLRVSTDEGVGPYIIALFEQLPAITRMLDHHKIRYWIEEDVISLDGSPATAVVNLGRHGDAKAIQAILDSDW